MHSIYTSVHRECISMSLYLFSYSHLFSVNKIFWIQPYSLKLFVQRNGFIFSFADRSVLSLCSATIKVIQQTHAKSSAIYKRGDTRVILSMFRFLLSEAYHLPIKSFVEVYLSSTNAGLLHSGKGAFFSSRFPFTLFHFIRLFWNQTLTWRSVKSKLTAISYRLSLVR